MDVKENPKLDNSKELVVIDYYDRIHGQMIKVEVTKEVARFLKADTQKTRRKQNEYNYYNKPIDKIFNDNRPENEHFLVDEHSDPEIVLEEKEQENLAYAEDEHNKTMIENSLYALTPKQREVSEMVLYKNMTYGEIGKELGISKQSVGERMKSSEKNIKKFIKNTEN